MNIEEAINYLEENLKNWKADRPDLGNSDIVEEVDKDYRAIETLLTAYEEKCKELKKEIQDDLDVRNRWGLTLQELEKEKEKNKEYEILLKRQEELEKEKENLIKQGWLNE